ncbi:hypothetical protein HH212_22920 [Massilia forsythiae]|uniref:Uncharacterized protein n=1 Tax=Massilia forsythiae TaxID=2728020 RepID=A0A7Z2W0I8_9BURK|nr:hypothetical protein [Massilia forsythiae]QJE02519.1 hypothetical protein HH212_22920 [Massilia forsythiae]
MNKKAMEKKFAEQASGEMDEAQALGRDGEKQGEPLARRISGNEAIQIEPLDKAGMEARKTTTRMGLIGQYQLDSAFIGVAKLAMILGRSPSAIYADMRAGRFFLPYRLFNKTPMICVDDLVAWFASGSDVVPAFGSKPEPREARSPSDAADGAKRALSLEEVNAAVEKVADDAMRAAGIDPSKRRRRRQRP